MTLHVTERRNHKRQNVKREIATELNDASVKQTQNHKWQTTLSERQPSMGLHETAPRSP
jgi:hypothetical protein